MTRFNKFLTPQGLILLEGWARNGLTMRQIAHNCGISIQGLYKWFKKYPQIKEAVDKGKEVVDFEVEGALYRSALGYSFTEQVVDSNGNKRMVKKHIPANVVAQIFWLKNRCPDRWKDKTTTEFSGQLPVIIKDDIKE